MSKCGKCFDALHANSTQQRTEVDAPCALSCCDDFFIAVLADPQFDCRSLLSQTREPEIPEMVGRRGAFGGFTPAGGVVQHDFNTRQVSQTTVASGFADVACYQVA